MSIALPRYPALHPLPDPRAFLFRDADAEAVPGPAGHRPLEHDGLVDSATVAPHTLIRFQVHAVGIGTLQSVRAGMASETGTLEDGADVDLVAEVGRNDLFLAAAGEYEGQERGCEE